MNAYIIRVFQKTNFSEYNNLVNFSQKIKPPDYVISRRAWWCFDNKNDSAFAAAFYNDEVVATCFISGKILNINKEKVFAYEIGETATKEEHQRKGLFSKLVKACLSYAFDNGAELVYGTPNSQSTPGYKKLGFNIIENENNNLQFIPSLIGLTRKNFGLKSNRSDKLNDEIAAQKYYEISKDGIRLNSFSEEYFKWRFVENKNLKFKFFEYDGFFMATRPIMLGDMKVLQVAEYYCNRHNFKNTAVGKHINMICRRNFSMNNYDGIYFLANRSTKIEVIKSMTISIVHRNLPMCVMAKNESSEIYNYLSKCGLPQLSDCDIG